MKKEGMPLLCYEWSLNIRLSTPLTFWNLVSSYNPEICQNRPPSRAERAGHTWCTGELCSWGSGEPPPLAPRGLEGKTFKLVDFCSGETEI